MVAGVADYAIVYSGDAIRAVLRQIVYDDQRAVTRKKHRVRTAEPTAGTRHDGDTSFD